MPLDNESDFYRLMQPKTRNYNAIQEIQLECHAEPLQSFLKFSLQEKSV
jgi:hypothetical protein